MLGKPQRTNKRSYRNGALDDGTFSLAFNDLCHKVWKNSEKFWDWKQMPLVCFLTAFLFFSSTSIRVLNIARALILLTQFSARARIAKSKHCFNTAIILFTQLNASVICTIFPHNLAQCFDGFSLL